MEGRGDESLFFRSGPRRGFSDPFHRTPTECSHEIWMVTKMPEIIDGTPPRAGTGSASEAPALAQNLLCCLRTCEYMREDTRSTHGPSTGSQRPCRRTSA